MKKKVEAAKKETEKQVDDKMNDDKLTESFSKEEKLHNHLA